MGKEREENDGLIVNRHHLVPRSKWGLSNEVNVIKLPVNEHIKLHSYFGNATPVEQICKILLVNEKVRSENFKADLIAVLDNYLNKYYEKKSHKWMIRSEIENVMWLQC